MDKIGQRNRVIAIFYKENRIYTDKMKLNILRLLRGRSAVRIRPGTPYKSKSYREIILGMIKNIIFGITKSIARLLK